MEREETKSRIRLEKMSLIGRRRFITKYFIARRISIGRRNSTLETIYFKRTKRRSRDKRRKPFPPDCTILIMKTCSVQFIDNQNSHRQREVLSTNKTQNILICDSRPAPMHWSRPHPSTTNAKLRDGLNKTNTHQKGRNSAADKQRMGPLWLINGCWTN